MFKSLWLTTNADTIYVVGALDLTMVLATAPGGFSAPSIYEGLAAERDRTGPLDHPIGCPA